MRKPWFRKQNATWYVTVDGVQVMLGPDRDAAFKTWHEMQARGRPDSPGATVDVVVEEYLVHAEKHLAEATYRAYGVYLASFCARCGTKLARELKPIDVTRWLDAQSTWGDASRRYATAAVKRAFNWAVDQELLERSPIARVKRPSETKREATVSAEVFLQLLAESDAEFRMVLIALAETGARPEEVRLVTAGHVDDGCSTWTFHQHKTKAKTGKAKVVYLTPLVRTITTILKHFRPSGPLFRNAHGEPWSSNAVRLRMKRLRDKLKLPPGIVAYSFRHTFATQGLLAGVDAVTMAKLLGHADTKMLSRHYAHIDAQAEHLKASAEKAARSRTEKGA